MSASSYDGSFTRYGKLSLYLSKTRTSCELTTFTKNSSENSYCVLPREGRVAVCRLCAKRMMDGTQRLRRRSIPSPDCSCPRRLSRVLRGAWRLHADLFVAYLSVPWPLLAYCNIYCLPQTKRSKEVNGQCSTDERHA